MSEPIFLDKCRIYQMEVFMRDLGGGNHASVGMRKPSGEYERPIPGSRLFWTKSGKFAMCSYLTTEHSICHLGKTLVFMNFSCLHFEGNLQQAKSRIVKRRQ